MIYKRMVLLGLVALSNHVMAGELPDPNTTPGALNPAVTQANIHETICVKGYTKTIRPPASYTSKLKREQIGREGDMKEFEEDHLVPIGLGGNPTDVHNLWAQQRGGEYNAEKKDELELKLMDLVCHGQLPLATAQHDIATNWIQAYKTYGGEKYNGGAGE